MTLNNLFPSPVPGVNGQGLSVSSSGATFATQYTSPNIKTVIVDVRDGDVYVTFDGQTPSSTIGHKLPANTSYHWSVAAFNAAKFTSVSTTGYLFATPFHP